MNPLPLNPTTCLDKTTDGLMKDWRLKTLDQQMQDYSCNFFYRAQKSSPQTIHSAVRSNLKATRNGFKEDYPSGLPVDLNSWTLAGRVARQDVLSKNSDQIAVVEALVEKNWAQMDWRDVPDFVQQPMWVAAVLVADRRQKRFLEGTVLDNLVRKTLASAPSDQEREHRIVKLLATAPNQALSSVLDYGIGARDAQDRWVLFPQEALIQFINPDRTASLGRHALQAELMARHAHSSHELNRWSQAALREGLRGWQGCLGPSPFCSSEPWFKNDLVATLKQSPPSRTAESTPLCPSVIGAVEALIIEGCQTFSRRNGSLFRRGVPFAISPMATALYESGQPVSTGFRKWLLEAAPSHLVPIDQVHVVSPRFKSQWMDEVWEASSSAKPRPRL